MLERSDGAKFLENYELGSNATLFSPQGGLRASASDLSSILAAARQQGALNGRKILKEAQWRLCCPRVEFKCCWRQRPDLW